MFAVFIDLSPATVDFRMRCSVVGGCAGVRATVTFDVKFVMCAHIHTNSGSVGGNSMFDLFWFSDTWRLKILAGILGFQCLYLEIEHQRDPRTGSLLRIPPKFSVNDYYAVTIVQEILSFLQPHRCLNVPPYPD